MSENTPKNESNSLIYAKFGARIGLIAALYIVFSATVFHYLEGWAWLDSFYFVVVTLSTVGYGDISPKTDLGKLFTIFFIILGIVIFSAAITNITTKARKRREKRTEK